MCLDNNIVRNIVQMQIIIYSNPFSFNSKITSVMDRFPAFSMILRR